MPGIDTGAPERTATSSGRRSPPKLSPVAFSTSRMPWRSNSAVPSGSRWPVWK